MGLRETAWYLENAALFGAPNAIYNQIYGEQLPQGSTDAANAQAAQLVGSGTIPGVTPTTDPNACDRSTLLGQFGICEVSDGLRAVAPIVTAIAVVGVVGGVGGLALVSIGGSLALLEATGAGPALSAAGAATARGLGRLF